MAKKYYCDRCGKEIRLTRSFEFMHKVYYAHLFENDFMIPDKEIKAILCPECHQKLVEFMGLQKKAK